MLHVQQNIIRGKLGGALQPWAMSVWVGTIGGSAIATDPDPNTTPPSAGRIVRASPFRLALFGTQTQTTGQPGFLTVVFGVVASSSITVQFWFFDATQNKWVPYAGPTTKTPTTNGANVITNVVGTNILAAIGCKAFVQVTANTNVQAMGYGIT
jgi:hypothetical protein